MGYSIILLAVFFTLTFAQRAWFNGVNVPWNKFGYDIGSGAFDQNWFNTFFQMCTQNHVNSARFWLHCDGRASPQFNSDGTVSGLSSTFLTELKQLTDMAKSHNVVLMICLWSFDMCKHEATGGYHPELISNPTARSSYIQKALIPMLQALASYDNVIWEIINEPEWCIKETPGNTEFQATLVQMQAFAGAIADAIHKNSRQTVTLGSSCLKWNSDANPPAVGNWWSDKSLQSAFSSNQAKLDFYQIHYYDWMYNSEWGFDPMREPATYWKLDKPTMVGELPATGGQYYTPDKLMNGTLANGFWGNAFWAYNADFDWHKDVDAWNQFYASHSQLASYNTLVSWLKGLRDDE